jgi:hypothetical protein
MATNAHTPRLDPVKRKMLNLKTLRMWGEFCHKELHYEYDDGFYFGQSIEDYANEEG